MRATLVLSPGTSSTFFISLDSVAARVVLTGVGDVDVAPEGEDTLPGRHLQEQIDIMRDG
jgi:hypothetical protein